MIKVGSDGKKISNIIITTAMGHSCAGLFPYTWRRNYRKMIEVIIKTNTSVISKSSTPDANQGRVVLFNQRKPWTIFIFLYTANKYIKKLSDKEMLNSYGLTNLGIKVHGEEICEATESGIMAIPNIFLFLEKKTLDQLIKEAIRVADFVASLPLRYKTLVWNWSCPNSGEDVCAHFDKIISIRKAVKKEYPLLTMIDKMSPMHPLELFQEMEKDGKTIFDLFNTISFKEVFPGKNSPIKNVPGGGGYSGPASKVIIFPLLKEAGERLKSDIIMGHGVDCEYDVETLFGFGAKSVSICKMALQNTNETIKILEKFNTH